MSDIPIYSIPEALVEFEGFRLFTIKSVPTRVERYPGFPRQTNVPHRHDFFEIFIFFKGKGTHEIDFKSYPVNDCSIHFVTPGQVHMISERENSDGYLLTFTEEFIELNKKLAGIDLIGLPQPYLDIDSQDFGFVQKVLDEIMYECSSPRKESEEIIKSYLYILVLKTKSLYRDNVKANVIPEVNRDVIFNSFRDLVEKNYDQNQQVNYYSDQLNISPSHLNKISKKVCGKTASDFIHDRVILEAKRLLIFSNMSSKEIAYHLMYEDPSYFSRIFKKKSGLSPTEFRRVKLEKYQPEVD